MNPTQGITNELYLKNLLFTAKSQLEEKKVKHRIAIAVFDTEREFLQNQIDSIERQLETNKSSNK